MVDPIRNVGGRPIGQYTSRQEALEAFQRSDASIPEILANLGPKVNRADIEAYLRQQHCDWKEKESAQPAYSASGEPAPLPALVDLFPDNASEDQSLDDEDRALLAHGMMRAQVSKDLPVGHDPDPNAPPADPNRPLTADELAAQAESTIDEFHATTQSMMGNILDAQMRADMEQKLSEVHSEVAQILAKVKSGELQPEYAIMALMKVSQSRSGSLMVWMGKKMDYTNSQMNHTTDLLSSSPSMSEVSAMQNQTREGGFQMQQLTSNMQQITASVQSTAESGKGMIDTINRMRDQTIQNMKT